MADDAPSNIVALPEVAPDTVTLKEHDWSKRPCDHLGVEVAENARTLSCRACGASLDPIDFLVAWSKRKRLQRYEDKRITELHNELTVHAIGVNGERTRCGAGKGGRYTVTVTNRAFRVSCRKCRAKTGSVTHLGGEELLLGDTGPAPEEQG